MERRSSIQMTDEWTRTPRAAAEPRRVAPTQEALYRELDVDPDLSWSESDLPERERTKHVHRLHPYLGKYVPQLVEALLARHLPRAKTVLDPFAGSGTTLVQSLEDGRDAVGIDVAAFNCLLMEVKTGEYNLFTLERELRDSLRRLEDLRGEPSAAALRLPRQVVRAPRRGRARVLPLLRRRVRARRRPARRARTGGSLGTPDDALRPRLPAPAAGRRVLVPQAQEDLPPGRARRAFPAPLRARHARAGPRVLARARARARGPGAARRRPQPRPSRPVRRGRHVAALPGPDRLPRAAPLRLRAARPRRQARPRARCGRAGSERAGDPRLRGRHRRSARQRARRSTAAFARS